MVTPMPPQWGQVVEGLSVNFSMLSGFLAAFSVSQAGAGSLENSWIASCGNLA
jgi:hypothetical protein